MGSEVASALIVIAIMVGGAVVSLRTHNFVPSFIAVLLATIASIVGGLLRG